MSSRAAATKAFCGAAGIVGAGIALRGAFLPSTPHTVAGMCLLLAASTLLTLSLVRGWLIDSSAERARLREQGDKLEAERTGYVAAHAALSAERDRVRADLRDAQEETRRTLAREREAMRDEFDAERSELIRSTFETAVRMVQDGLLETPAEERDTGRVIPLPTPHEYRHAVNAQKPS